MELRPSMVSLTASGFDPDAFADLRRAFLARNPDHDLAWLPGCPSLGADARPRIAFVVNSQSGDLDEGDVLVARPETSRTFAAPVDLLVFTLTEPLPENLPETIRPDHDPAITDTPGGCATDAHAYRRICLTWLQENGPYTYRALNAHRVRMWDSFTHYHPADNGFDELYLVHEVHPGAHVLVSPFHPRIEQPDQVTADEAPALLQRLEPHPGDLIFLPRGLIHRAVGGILAQVITLPGFRPGCEIGVDHHLRAIGERLGMGPEQGLYWQDASSRHAVVK